MQAEEDKQFFEGLKIEGLKIMVRDIRSPMSEEPFGEKIPLEVEKCLWSYALGISSPQEQRQVVRWLAISPRIQQELTRIQQFLQEAGVLSPLAIGEEAESSPALQQAWQQVLQWAQMVPELFGSLAAVIVDTAERLLWSQEAPAGQWDLRSVADVVVPQPVMMDGSHWGEFPPRIEIRCPEGIQVTVDRIGHGNLHLKVSVAAARVEDRVQLFQLVPSAHGVQQRLFGETVPLQEGKAYIPECPPGLWKIVVSDGRQVCLFIYQPEEKGPV